MSGRPLFVFGTRPEAIKLAPVFRALGARGVEARLCVTAQHRQLLDQVLEFFDLKPHHDLDLMRPDQSLFDVTASALLRLRGVLKQEQPSVVLVQGDTTTVFAASLAAFYLGIPVAHVEAGLRTGNKRAPFPEEANRLLTSDLADLHFAPTAWARNNLLREGRDPRGIFVTGNTVVDALRQVDARVGGLPDPPDVEAGLAYQLNGFLREPHAQVVLVTAHRRESFGPGFEDIAGALRDVADGNPHAHIVYPVHLNPRVQEPVRRILASHPRVHLLPPLPYSAFVWLLRRSTLVLTDSGGVQEEAPSLGKPVLVMRETTERPEAVEAGTALLVGTSRKRIAEEAGRLLSDPAARARMVARGNPFGDGRASERIVQILQEKNLT